MKIPSEKQLESTFEVLAWLDGQLQLRFEAFTVHNTRLLIKREVDRCLEETVGRCTTCEDDD